MVVTAGIGDTQRKGLGAMTILDPTKGAPVTINNAGAMFDKNGNPTGATSSSSGGKWTRPTKTVQTGGAVGGEVVSQTAGGITTPNQMLSVIKNDTINNKEANMGLNSLMGGFNGTATRGLGIAGSVAPVVGAGVAQSATVNQTVTKEANMGLNSLMGGFNGTATRGLGIAGSVAPVVGAGVAQSATVNQTVTTPNRVVTTPVTGAANQVVGAQPSVVVRPGSKVVMSGAVNPVQPGVVTMPNGSVTTPVTGAANQVVGAQPSVVVRPGSKVVMSGAVNPVQPGVVTMPNGSAVVPGSVVTADQKIANAKRNAGKLLNKLMEMAYGLTEQEEKYLLELLDSIGMKETFLSAAGLGTATPINPQVVLSAINEMNQVMVANANVTSTNIELANSIYGKLDTLTLEAQAGGYNEADLISVLAELYASGMINIQDTSKPNMIFCFNTLKSQIERMIGGVQPNGVLNNGVVRTATPATPINIQQRPIVGANTTQATVGQAGGKMFNRPVNQIQNRFTSPMAGGLGGVGVSRVSTPIATSSMGGGVIPNASGLNFGRTAGAGMIQTSVGANSLRTPLTGGVQAPVMGGGLVSRAAGLTGYYNTANQDVSYSNRGGLVPGAGMLANQQVAGGVMTRPMMGAGVAAPVAGAVGPQPIGGVLPRATTGMAAGYNNNVMQGSVVGSQSPIMQYMSM